MYELKGFYIRLRSIDKAWVSPLDITSGANLCLHVNGQYHSTFFDSPELAKAELDKLIVAIGMDDLLSSRASPHSP